VVIHGPRRVGKSTLLLAVIAELLTHQHVDARDIYFFDLDTSAGPSSRRAATRAPAGGIT
jgi:predicted AAA+ superfamily ATPase